MEVDEQVTGIRARGPLFRTAIMLVLGVALLAWFLWRADLVAMAGEMAQANPLLMAAGILLNLLTPWLKAARFNRVYAIRGRNLEMFGVMGYYGLLNTFMPLRTGEVAFLVLLKRRSLIPSIAEALPRWLLLRACDVAAVMGLVLLTALFLPVRAGMEPWLTGAWIAFGLTVVGTVAVQVIVRHLPQHAAAPPGGYMRGRIWALRRGFEGLDGWTTLLVALGWSIAIWLWSAAVLSLEYAAFPTDLSPPLLWLVAVGVLGVSMLPIHAPLAIGTMHAAQVGLLHAVGVPMSEGLGIAIGVHAAILAMVALQGVVGTLALASCPIAKRVESLGLD